jgi:transcription-repair coupling factor (superfamily II helicase)
VAFVTTNDVFARYRPRPAGLRRRLLPRRSQVDQALDFAELANGDPLVHLSHGVCLYRGLARLDGKSGEVISLEFADGLILHVPLHESHLLTRYVGLTKRPPKLGRLGTNGWEKTRGAAEKATLDFASTLLHLQAQRSTGGGFQFSADGDWQRAFDATFPFEETPDQKRAIDDCKRDMEDPRSMDRLICGDVGFGKTEVALRAAFKAVMDGKQVAVLVPTTVLAQQHFNTFRERLAEFPVTVEVLSRFRTREQQADVVRQLQHGQIDIVVGTHRILSKDVKFHDLGLLVIDEEHRFGVRHKEQMKALRAEVDVLTLTATPIPRTLGMALEGLRDLSVIATAPQRRLAIKTFVRNEGTGVIREAVLRELKRGGQCYFLHNEVETIENRRQKLEEILPEARIAVAHGQMPERELERVMRDFVAQRYNILLCSTIIETGIDVPTANTIVISRADKFGLAQLHQLRGRVGRSHHQAYAYLMVPDIEGLTKQAAQRLDAIQQMEELGSGFYLAMHDLEIRGAGEVLGEHQSGNMLEVGFQLYNEMLSEAVRCLKAGKEPDLLSPLSVTTDINLHAPALLPDDYCGDVHLRLSFYKKLATAKTSDQIDGLLEEIVDRFGKLPPQAQTLIDVHRLRVLSQPYGVVKVDAAPGVITITFKPQPPIDPMRIIELIQKNKHIRLAGNEKLRIERELNDPKDRAQMVRDILRSLGQPLAQPAAA